MLEWLYIMLINSVAILISAYLLKGVTVKSFGRAFIAAMILGIVNAFVRPLFILLTLPLTIITLGLFLLVVNVLARVVRGAM